VGAQFTVQTQAVCTNVSLYSASCK